MSLAVHNQGVRRGNSYILDLGQNPISKVLFRQQCNRIQSLFPTQIEQDLKGAIDEKDRARIQAFPLDAITRDGVKSRIARMLHAYDPQVCLDALPRLNITRLQDRLDLASMHYNSSGSLEMLELLNITSDEDKLAFMDLLRPEPLSVMLRTLRNLQLESKSLMRKKAEELLEKDLFSLGVLIRKPNEMKQIPKNLQMTRDSQKLSFLKAAIRANPWGALCLIQHIPIKDSLKKAQLGYVWVEELKRRRDEGDILIDPHHEIKKSVKVLLTGDSAVDLAFIKHFAKEFPIMFTAAALRIIPVDDKSAWEPLHKIIMDTPSNIKMLRRSHFLKLPIHRQQMINEWLQKADANEYTNWMKMQEEARHCLL